VSDGWVESQRPYVVEVEGQKSHYDLKVRWRRGQHVNIVLVQGYDRNSDLELPTSWG